MVACCSHFLGERAQVSGSSAMSSALRVGFGGSRKLDFLVILELPFGVLLQKLIAVRSGFMIQPSAVKE